MFSARVTSDQKPPNFAQPFLRTKPRRANKLSSVHRKEWSRAQLQKLASFFAIEICGYAVLSNHFHVILRMRPDLAREWTHDDVAHRWRLLFPPRDEATGRQVEPEQHDHVGRRTGGRTSCPTGESLVVHALLE